MSAEALETGFVEARDAGVFARAGVLRRLARDRVAALAALALTVIVFAALLAPWIAPYDPYFTDLTKVMRPPDAEHWFGTDNTGRDILSRVIYGTRNALMLGLGRSRRPDRASWHSRPYRRLDGWHGRST
jgi:ABC-type dipeptide/oligopeptide/nickel transport system permease subunit